MLKNHGLCTKRSDPLKQILQEHSYDSTALFCQGYMESLMLYNNDNDNENLIGDFKRALCACQIKKTFIVQFQAVMRSRVRFKI